MNQDDSTLNEQKFKIVFLGDSSVGKTSIVEQIMYGSFQALQQPTICLASAKKMVMHRGQVYKLSLWDTAGQEKFNSMIPGFVRGCDCAVIVFDVTNPDSLTNCQKWIKMVMEDGFDRYVPMVLVANKADLTKVTNAEQTFDLALKHGMTLIDTSAKTGQGIQSLVAEIVEGLEKSKFKSQKETKSSESQIHTSRKLAPEPSKIEVKRPAPVLAQMKFRKSTCCSV